MQAYLKKVQVNPAKHDKTGEETKEKTAVITLEVPLDNIDQSESLLEVMEHISEMEMVSADIQPYQAKLPLGSTNGTYSEGDLHSMEGRK